MKNRVYIISLLMLFSIVFNKSEAQNFDLNKIPKDEYLDSAKDIAKGIFKYLEKKENKKIADFLVKSLGYNWDESTRITQHNDYLAKLEIISLNPPNGVYGDLTGYDLIEEGFIYGSDRYFRHTYITYHQGSLLLWEFRFFVDKDEKVILHYIGWSDKNPFEYLSTPDMILPKYK